MPTWAKFAGAGVGVLALGLFAAWASAPDPTHNPASFENAPLDPAILPLSQGVTLARFVGEDGAGATMIVLSSDGESVTGIDLRELGAQNGKDPFTALAEADLAPLLAGERDRIPTVTRTMGDLLPSAPAGTRHIGTGTNFPEHAEEANSASVFQFPKFGGASPARTTVRAQPGILLDYEVELCVRFDRDIASLADFDAAVKGFFLCGDFTNRNALVNLADPDNLDSGRGFSDAKSGPDFFPTGPFLVVPGDWRAFTQDLRMTTELNGEPRQDARGGEMTLDFRALAEKALGDMDAPRFVYGDAMYRLSPGGRIEPSMTLMSGTAEGTIFTPPTRADMIEAVLAYLAGGGPLGSRDFMTAARAEFIASELEGGHFLKAGDVVRHGSNHLGDIEVRVID
ncbi:fumarylacetoacetate hydrolase family protein [Erythrobacter sp.]|uniref:fumarylacetoacetate hydrolase family protein n=1 Tax=Erythrobacter sp. TaxID=1042 RepID=UPI001425FC53|nr:fumarylacetoacetate hydrolase family protein [Erythrobacter sp.]QIQ86346.1 MAG: fumarylacetoacetate hydrolase family protein [Erythrobacter sp.]